MKCYLHIASLFIETEKARDKKITSPQAKQPHKPSNPTSQATPTNKVNLRRSQETDNIACRATLRRKQTGKPTKLFEESSTPSTKATLRRKKEAPLEDTAFVNNKL